ncbi:MAG: hypothetical protein SLAVMIC_00762 [uncultured marine phage]|uniref:Uncharacterized protein n=1 Tax=uncultured marine phage TaxID=707152 RepID=A0A8D9FRD0_9VIRU|nr:MAG: hypothetical protein SLAVMIC_00762 [uncultured marine phage]
MLKKFNDFIKEGLGDDPYIRKDIDLSEWKDWDIFYYSGNDRYDNNLPVKLFKDDKSARENLNQYNPDSKGYISKVIVKGDLEELNDNEVILNSGEIKVISTTSAIIKFGKYFKK